MALGQLSPRKIAFNPNTNFNPNPNPNPKRGAVFLGDNCLDNSINLLTNNNIKPVKQFLF